MERDIFFMPLGGGQRVGGSCYYLRLNGINIILDAGTGKKHDVEFGPDFHSLLISPFVQSMNQISQVFISHAHLDHVGYLLKLMAQTEKAAVYMTEVTKMLAEFQLYDRYFCTGSKNNEDARLAAKSLLEKIAVVSYMQKMDFGRYRASFYPAGHIPGAMMVLFDTGKRKILYTGDYSLGSTLLTSGCMIPADIPIDTVLMCGLHAKHPGYVKRADGLFQNVQYVFRCVENRAHSVLCRIPQLSKGIEFLKALNENNKSGIPIYLDGSVLKVVEKMEQLSVPIINEYNKVMGDCFPREPHIYLTSNMNPVRLGFYHDIKVDFSLHEDFGEMKKFIKKINPRQAVVVHCGKEYSAYDKTIEQEMMLDSDCRTQFIFAEEGEIYRL